MNDIALSLDTVWMLLAAMLVFWMQPGFALCEAGFTRGKNTANILFKDFEIGLCFFRLHNGAGRAGRRGTRKAAAPVVAGRRLREIPRDCRLISLRCAA